MSDQPEDSLPPHDDWQPDGDGMSPSGDVFRGRVRQQNVAARVPEGVSRGVFSTGAIVLTARTEYCIDFVLRLVNPHQVVARVILPHAAMPQLLTTIEKNMQHYRERFGEPPTMPTGDSVDRSAKPSTDQPPIPAATDDNPLGEPTLQSGQAIGPSSPAPDDVSPTATPRNIHDVYDELKLPDDMMAGAYANSFVVTHSASEFCIDFIANFFPKPAVSARVFFSVQQVPRLLIAFRNAVADLERRGE